MADPSFPALHIRPPQGWLNDPNGLCRIDGRYHVFFQYNPIAPVFGAMHWGHVSSTDLLNWQLHPIALAPRPGLIDQAGCWSGCIVDDGGIPTAVYTANQDQPSNAVAALARSDRSLDHWRQDTVPISGISQRSVIDEVRDPFVFVHEGHRYAVQGAGQRSGQPRLQLYGCDDLSRWTELGTLLTTDDPIAAELAPANIWECPNLVRMDGQWVVIFSLCHTPAGIGQITGVRYLVGDLVPEGGRWSFQATSGGALDHGPAFYAPQVLAEQRRTLLWGWAWELSRSAQHETEAGGTDAGGTDAGGTDAGGTDAGGTDAGWAGVLTFPRELYLRDGALGVRPATELEGLRRGRMNLRPGAPFQAHAFELVAAGPVALRLTDEGVDELVAVAEATPSAPARILVDGSIVEIFHRGTSHTTRAYPTISSSWVVEGGAVSAYRLGDRGADSAAASDLPRNLGARLNS